MRDDDPGRSAISGPVLAFDTSGPWIMAGLAGGLPVIAGRTEEMARGQAERLMPLLEEHLAAAGLSWADLAGIGVGIGPGNFTGIRIAVAAARGVALGLKIPAVGLSQFEMMLGDAVPQPVLVSLPAPQDRAYVQPFLQGRPLAPPALIAPGEAPGDLRRPGLGVIGHRAAEIAAGLGAQARDIPYWRERPELDWPNALATLAWRKLRAGGDHPRPAPLYVRPADAAPPSDPPPVILDA